MCNRYIFRASFVNATVIEREINRVISFHVLKTSTWGGWAGGSDNLSLEENWYKKKEHYQLGFFFDAEKYFYTYSGTFTTPYCFMEFLFFCSTFIIFFAASLFNVNKKKTWDFIGCFKSVMLLDRTLSYRPLIIPYRNPVYTCTEFR